MRSQVESLEVCPRKTKYQLLNLEGNPLIQMKRMVLVGYLVISEDGFRHTTKERKEIKRGKLPLRAATGHTNVTGTSTRSHGISASLQGQNAPHLIYVGRLNPHTTTEQLREHMHDVGITDIAF